MAVTSDFSEFFSIIYTYGGGSRGSDPSIRQPLTRIFASPVSVQCVAVTVGPRCVYDRDLHSSSVLPEYPRPEPIYPEGTASSCGHSPAGKPPFTPRLHCQWMKRRKPSPSPSMRGGHPCPGRAILSSPHCAAPSTDFHVLAGMELLQRRGVNVAHLLTWVALSHPRKPLNLSYQDAELAVLHQRVRPPHRTMTSIAPHDSLLLQAASAIARGGRVHARRAAWTVSTPFRVVSSSHSPLPDLPDNALTITGPLQSSRSQESSTCAYKSSG
ncbi:hypothetical protein B0H13DRAFT_2494771 [Mycena leptocephala]|nr:hypothetical protein B0H13DRAFT_2494771 [Mycena leptocephala]